ncbi:chemotaxis-specific protein-glutamate methyltransferase CheB [Sphingomonas sp. BN140010]|uniref:Protein-glutamate methylesterase/protein-glutamine glutaminase n=1 Tax=Sphingomonas arvum TaxID=2992113 RepID=A0ABT3JIF1_9SPHN|nr:chemotaxis-specific protein-glutamate methyltransferase CheB [Sphingomonas sp. BN140010]MCW3798864.1 chemotaxis-specific protein-glutamate methyltransferase CheB [Sphingomonas sp. BN140010]
MSRALASSRSGDERQPIRLMIVDDSTVARAVLSRMVEGDGGFEVAALASTAEGAIDALATVSVDVILLDLEMPGAGGLKMLPRILDAARGARVIIVSSLAEEGAQVTVSALALGAADTMPKPGIGRFNGKFSEVLLGKLKALGSADQAQVARHRGAALRAMGTEPMQCLAVGASTGGIHALQQMFSALPAELAVPILVTQHLPAAFMTVFARQLGTAARRRAMVAEDGMPLLRDIILVAPGDAHLTVENRGGKAVVRLDRRSAASGCLPSVDPMLTSVADFYGGTGLGVILSGMGRDGLLGAGRLVKAGGSILAQDEATCAVWGMPKAVTDAGLASAVLPPTQIARRVASRAGEQSWK